MKKNILSLFCIICLNSCYTCYDVKRHCETLSYSFMVTQKSKDNRDFIFSGIDKNNRFIKFKEPQYWDIYDSVEVGDTLLKKIGEPDLILIKKETTLIFPLLCGGRPVE